ncbi:hypothetical protein ACWA7J_05810 [Leptothrix sp. BB-4]
MDWFERITGFAEGDASDVRSRLKVDSDAIVNIVNGRRFGMGTLEIVSLAELRERVGRLDPIAPTQGPQSVRTIRGDVRRLHLSPEHAGALFQVASQFNLLEMVGPSVTPDDGVTRYLHDPTQGPACAIAAGAGTIYRNYLVPVDGGVGQTRRRQVNTLSDLGAALGHDNEPLWDWRNGYALCTGRGLARIDQVLQAADDTERDRLRGQLRIGLHWDVEVTDAPTSPGPRVSQAYCSALPVAYGEPPRAAWAGFAQLVLEAAYEATLLAALLNHRRGASQQVLLTRLGGGVFGNDDRWIDAAMERALGVVAGQGLDVCRVVR